MHGIRTLLLPLLLNATALAGCAQVHFQEQSPGPDAAAAGFQPASSQQLEDILRASPAAILHEPLHMQDALLAIYQKHQFRPLWASDRQVKQAVAALGGAIEYGLQPRDYHLPAITGLLGKTADPAAAAALDVLLSDGILLYIHHRREGKVHPGDLYPEFNFERDHSADLPPDELLRQAIAADDLAGFIDAQAPTAHYYEVLRRQLDVYRAFAAHGGWPHVPVGPTLRRNDRDPRVIAIRKRLQMTGELQSSLDSTQDSFTEELEHAVMRFQSRHGLVADGLVGKQTLAAMNVDAATRVNQLRLSLERLRWLDHNADNEFIAVNIAGFRLAYVKGQEIEWTTKVIVGTPYRRTPVFRSLMTYVEFNPDWTIPPTILREDTLPAIRKNPDYLAERNISVVDRRGKRVDPSTVDWQHTGKTFSFTLRQEPGPNNALGRVKFIFPNPYSVYMHDTPNQALFEQSARSFSSGCIRVQNPFRLVELVLQKRQNFTVAELEEILRRGQTRRVILEKPLPVMILYLTAALDETGQAQFYPDVYQRDPAVLELLDAPVTLPMTSP